MAPLRALLAAELIAATDAYVAEALVRRAEESDVALGVACACLMKAQSEGDVCLDLEALSERVDGWVHANAVPEALKGLGARGWAARLDASSLVSEIGDCPLVLEGERLYLQRNWNYECRVAEALLDRLGRPDMEVPEVFPFALDKWFPAADETSALPAAAALLAAKRSFVVITGGPGTGKTTVLGRLIGLLSELDPARRLRIGVAAPTGKGAQRADHALNAVLARLEPTHSAPSLFGEAVTLHRLLGARKGASPFRYGRSNPLALDVLFVDEGSMVDSRMMAHLLEALPKEAKLVLLGDPDQLAAVEAGAVLGEICRVAEGLSPASAQWLNDVRAAARARAGSREGGGVTPELIQGLKDTKIHDARIVFRQRHRFSGNDAIPAFSDAIRTGKAERAFDLLEKGEGLTWVRLDEAREDALIAAAYECYADLRESALGAGAEARALERLGDFQLLSPYRFGQFGTEQLNRDINSKAGVRPGTHPHASEPGTPVIVVRNDYDTGLFNGDVGLVMPAAQGVRAVFPGNDVPRSFPRTRLPAIELGYALTVHKAQGSEYQHVMLVLPERESTVGEPLLTRQLLYTAVTRARARVTLWSSERTLLSTLETVAQRASGLGERLQSGVQGAREPGQAVPAPVQQTLF